MLDFASALYLGMRHESRSLRPWGSLSSGVPAALAPDPGARVVASRLARLVGSEAALLGPSTLHLFWDLFVGVARGEAAPIAVYLDAGAYPIARWGVERAAGHGVPVRAFRHHDPVSLLRQLGTAERAGRRPLVVTDGFCPACGTVAPLPEYLAIARGHGGYLIVDDTQALGVLGRSPTPFLPYGTGGGGSPHWCAIAGPELLVVSSLAKGFGVPVALLAGASGPVGRFEATSETRVHCSPPSAAVVHAAERALDLNEACGDKLRGRLLDRVGLFRRRLVEHGLRRSPGLFPVQGVPTGATPANAVHLRVQQAGIRVVLHRAHEGEGSRISFLLTARHPPDDIRRAVAVLARAIRG